VQPEALLNEVVKNPLRLMRGKHIFRIRVDADPGYLPAQQNREQYHQCIDDTGAPDSQLNSLLLHSVSFGKSESSFKQAPDAVTAWQWYRPKLAERIILTIT
jgi:hypothetical protein